MTMWLIYTTPEDLFGAAQDGPWGTIVNVQATRPLSMGRNAVVAPNDGFAANFVVRDGVRCACPQVPLSVDPFAAAGRLGQVLGDLAPGASALFLLVATGTGTRVFQSYETDGKTTYFLALGDISKLDEDCAGARSCLQDTRDLALQHGPKINSRRIRQKWKADCELERKYTFAHVLGADGWSAPPVSIWSLSRALHDAALSGDLPGWIPEFNDEFHLWHYDSEIFEVTEPPAAQGYLAFIPQTDGNTTLKYKRFQQDAELRYESIAHHLPVPPDQYEQKARQVSGGTLRRLPGFRRTRFDVDVESLDTGNAFAIVVDISRPFDDSNALMSQSEVEYIRTRSVSDPTDVMKDFETVCAFAERVFRSCGAEYVQTPYSKLSFLRDVSQASAAGGAA